MDPKQLAPGQRVRIIQTVRRREGDWTRAVEGTVEKVTEEKTGSWYAHSKDDRYWLRRVVLRKADGEITILSTDNFTRVELLESDPSSAPS
jgi:hypothetical protein